MTLQAVLFDLDGTLLDTAPDFATALNRLLDEEDRQPLPEHTIGEMVTGGSASLISNAFDLKGIEPEFEPLRQRLLQHYRDCLVDRTRLYPGLDTLLELLVGRGIAWGIVTNKPEEYAIPILLGLNLKPGALVCPDHVVHTKPDPEPVLLACRTLDSKPAQTIFVGDHERDIESGRRAGAITVAAAYGYVPAGDSAYTWDATHVVRHSRDLAGIVRRYL